MSRATRLVALWLAVAAPVVSQTLGDRLELADESVVFSFRVASSGKTLSVLYSQAGDYLVYRFGSAAGIELEFPSRSAESWSQFTYFWYARPSMGGTNEGLYLKALRFENGGFQYEVYEESSDETPRPLVGVRVSKDGNLLVDIDGDPATALGSLIIFRLDFEGRVREAPL